CSLLVCVQYINDSNMRFIGSLIAAIAGQRWNLHKRTALRVLFLVGVLLLGFMLTTAFLSMWINNTAATAMMLPIAHGVLDRSKMSQENWAFEPDVPQENHGGNELESEENRELKYLDLSKGLSVCYAASIGGMATLTVTTPNVILKGQLDALFPGNGDIINFASWFCFSFPTMLLMLIFSWLWSANEREAYQVMKEEYKKLGSMGFAEGSVLVIFVFLVFLWLTRELGLMHVWDSTLINNEKAYVCTTVKHPCLTLSGPQRAYRPLIGPRWKQCLRMCVGPWIQDK
uniref:Uncharacterized protein n=1 Tax=Gadus morhua TaxID=8049 RepID=A0A8C4YWX9_GADMO